MSVTPSPQSERLSRSLAYGWSVGSFAGSSMFQATTVLLLSYLVNYVGIAAVTAGLLLGVSKIYDAVVDPLIGIMSDRTRSRWGRRRPYLLFGGFACGLSFWFLFSIPIVPDIHLRTGLVAIALIMNATAYALVVIPYIAMPAEMTDSPRERTYLMALRVAAVALGQVVGSFLGPQLISAYGGGLAGHRVMGLAVGVIIAVSTTYCFFATKTARFTTQVVGHGYSFMGQLRTAASNRPFLCLMGVKITSLSGLAVSTAITPFLFIQILKTNYGVMGIFFLVRSLMTFFVQPLWLHLTYRYGNKFTFYLSSLIYGLANISFLFADAGEPTWAIYLRGFFIGVSAGGQLLIGQALLPETIAYDFQRTGLRREGIFAGVYTTVEKASFALAGAGMGILLGSMGYVESTGQLVAQSHSALMAINICVASPALFQFLSSLFLHHYHLDTPEPASTQEALRDAMAR